MKSLLEKFGRFLETFSLAVVAVLAGAISLFLSMSSMLHTTAVDKIGEGQGVYTIVYNIKEKLESVIYYNDSLFLNMIALAVSLLVMFLIVKRIKPVKLYQLGLFLFLWTFILGTIWVLSSQSAPSEDSGTVTSASWSFAEGNYSALVDKRYFHNYSFQLGYVFFNEMIIRGLQLFGKLENLMPLEIFNAAFLGVINLFLLLINDKLFKDQRVNLVTTLLLALSAAPIISSSFVYGIYPGMMFAAIAIYCEIRYLEEDKILFGVFSALSMMLAIMAKSNYLIWLITLVLIVLVRMWKRQKFLRDIAYLVVTVTISMMIQPVIIRHYEKVSGTEIGDAIPYVSWIAMGLNETDLAPGWYNYYFTLTTFEQSDFNAEAAGEKSKEEIKNRLKYFAERPQYTHDFFYLKITSQWNDTAYQSIWNNVVRYQYKDKTALAAWVCGDGSRKMKKYMDLYAQLVFFAFCAGCWYMLRKKNFMLVPLPVIFLGGFFYQLISEGKSQYIMPYFIVMCAFSAFGIVSICDSFGKRLSPDKKLSRLLMKVAGMHLTVPAAEISEPEKSEPEKTEPEKSEPERTEPENSEPEKTEPEKSEPKKSESGQNNSKSKRKGRKR